MTLIRHRYDTEEVVKYIGDPNAGILILSREVFNMAYAYFLMHEWLIENDYATRNDWEFPEKYFMQRDSPAGYELRVRWRCVKKKTRDPLFHYKMDINWWALAVKDTEVVVKGKKLKMNTGELEIKLFPRMVLNPDYIKGPYARQFFKKFFLKRIIKKKVEALRKDLFDDAYRLQEALKTYLKIETYLEEPELKKFFTLRTGE